MNLLSKSLNATDSGGGQIQISARLVADRVRISVTDDGRGIRPDIVDRIFAPFFTRTTRGTGMGLTIVRRLVDQHRGEIAVDSEPGKGTTMRVELPLPVF